MSKPSYGFLSPQPYMQSAIDEMSARIDVKVMEAKTWQADEIAAHVADCKDKGIRSVGGFAQKDAFHHILINEGLGNAAPSRLSFLYCMNKYLMRTLETDPFYFDYVDPLKESDDEIIAKITEWPFMLKNTSLSLGRGIFKIETPQDLREVLKAYREDTDLQNLIASQYASYLDGVDPASLPEIIPPFVAERLVDMNKAIEYCYEGYVTPEGKVVHYALTEEVYFSNHQALGYVTPPISIDRSMADKIEAWIEDYMGKIAALGYVGQFFNIEFWVMPDGAIHLVEINPRAAHSYHYNYLYSFGSSLYEDNFRLAAGQAVEERTPWVKWREADPYRFTLIALITAKEIGPVSDILDYDYVQELERDGILVRHTRQRDDVLSEADMTAAGVMLLQIWLVADSKEETIAKEHELRRRIYRRPQRDAVYPSYWDV
ncbi:MAG: ATP-grasp domain-containing protein [Cohaesibacter sp.]|nr:ATP-grasp domain-containing protein [Cohaesibacter sp.]MCV6603144.1 ATP-grasp domain-containing protein [Cohaesibacter sp.]